MSVEYILGPLAHYLATQSLHTTHDPIELFQAGWDTRFTQLFMLLARLALQYSRPCTRPRFFLMAMIGDAVYRALFMLFMQ